MANQVIIDASEGLKDDEFLEAASDLKLREGLKRSLKSNNAAAAFEQLVVNQIDAEASRRKQENMSQFQKRLYGDFDKSNKIKILKVDKSAYDNYKKSIRTRQAVQKQNKKVDEKNAKNAVVEKSKSKDVEATKIKSDQENLTKKSEKKGKVGPTKKTKKVKAPDVSAKPTGVSVGKAEVMNKIKYDSQAAANSHFISFFFLGDLFDVVHDLVKEQGNLSEMPHIMLGSFRFYNHFTKSRQMLSLIHI